MIYLTDEHYKIAEQNGIYRDLAYQRYYILKWSIEDTITKQNRNSEDYQYWKNVAYENGLSYTGFRRRIQKGMSPKDAATMSKRKGAKSIGTKTYHK